MSRGTLVTLWLYMERACRATTASEDAPQPQYQRQGLAGFTNSQNFCPGRVVLAVVTRELRRAPVTSVVSGDTDTAASLGSAASLLASRLAEWAVRMLA